MNHLQHGHAGPGNAPELCEDGADHAVEGGLQLGVGEVGAAQSDGRGEFVDARLGRGDALGAGAVGQLGEGLPGRFEPMALGERLERRLVGALLGDVAVIHEGLTPPGCELRERQPLLQLRDARPGSGEHLLAGSGLQFGELGRGAGLAGAQHGQIRIDF